MTRFSRRDLLRTGAVAAAAGVAGCLGDLGLRGGAGGDGLALQRAAGPGPDAVPLVVPDRPIVLDFFATWCAPCRPQAATLREAASDRPDAHYVSITTESDADAVAQWWGDFGGDWPAVLDPEARAQSEYGAPRLPTTLVLPPGGGPGSETWRHVGVARPERVVEAIDEAAGANAPADPRAVEGGVDP